MIMPVGTVGRTKFRPYITFGLLLLNVLVFAIELRVMAQGQEATYRFFSNYALAICGIAENPFFLTLRNAIFTMFLHGDLFHVLFNMVFLWIFAPRVEAFFGHKRFLMFYLLAGLLASMAHVLMSGVTCPVGQFGADMMIGASGAIAGVMGGFLWLYPGARVRTVILFRVVPIPAFLYLLFWVATDIVSLIVTPGTQIAHWAHIGGFFAGVGILFMVTMFVPAPRGNPLEHLDE